MTMKTNTTPKWASDAMNKLKLQALAEPFANVDRGASIIASRAPEAEALAIELENLLALANIQDTHSPQTVALRNVCRLVLAAHRARFPKVTK